MGRFVEGEDRRQSLLLPESLDDYVAADNPVRVVEVFIDGLDLEALGFAGMTPAVTGRPAYHPSVMLKIYLYGYLNCVQSSRRLEREAGRNIELMWLTGRLVPDFKTIARFRRDDGKGIRAVCSQFVALCRKLKMFSAGVVALDRADREEGDVPEAKVARIRDKIAGLRRQMQGLQDMAKQVEASPDKQVSFTDTDARSMATQ